MCYFLCTDQERCLWPETSVSWIQLIISQPCPRQLLFSVIYLFFWVSLVTGLLRSFCKLPRRKASKTSAFVCTQAITFLLGLTYSAISVWSYSAQLHPIKTLFWLSQALAWATSFLILALEARYALEVHLPVLTRWWLGACMVSSAEVLLCGVGWIFSHIQRQSLVLDFVTTMTTSLATVTFFIVSPRGTTGFFCSEESVIKPLLSDSGPLSRCSIEQEEFTGYAKAGYFSKALFLWMSPLLSTGNMRTVQVEDIPGLMVEDRAETLYRSFDFNWRQQQHKQRSVAWSLLRSRWSEVAFTSFLNLTKLSVMFVGPLMIQRFISFASKPDGHWTKGVELVSILMLAKLVEELAERQRSFHTWKLCLSVKSTLVAVVYRKSLLLSNSARQFHGTGKIVNYMSVDVEEISNFATNFHNLWVMPIQIVTALFILFKIVGVSTVAGLGTMIVLMGFCLAIAARQRRCWKEIMACKDSRIKVTNEAITNMKIIKMQAWQDWFLRKVEQARGIEQVWASKVMYTSATSIFFLWLSPLAVSVATFGMCVFVGRELTAGRVFTAIATFRILQEPLRAFPSIIMAGSQAATALARLKKYLQSDEIDHCAVDRLPLGEEFAVAVNGGTFKWDCEMERPILENIHLEIKPGSLVTVVGTVGSGKSSLLASILGEMEKVAGEVKVSGRLAYVAQSPWIQNGSLRDNILFGKAMDPQLYRQTLRVCSLEADIAQFLHGDLTVIGERGFNLSGGQKQRIQLARALYQEADIYLLDDIFSAVDAHTGTAIFTDCVRGVLSNKTVILVTHQIEFLHGADLILVMKEGRIMQSGKFEELLSDGVHFNDLVNAHNQALQAINMSTSNQSTEDDIPDVVKLAASKSEIQTMNGEASDNQEEEERAKGRVDKTVYWAYITQAFHGFHVFLLLLIQSAWQALQIASDFWLAYSTSEKRKPFFRPQQFITIYSILALGSGLFVLMRSMLISFSGLITAQKLYLSMLRSVFRAPISFFDATPTGRILTRSSTDQLLVDFTLPFLYGSSLANGFQLIGVLTVTSGITWQLIVVLLPLTWIYLRYQSYFIITSRELTRLKSITDAPVIHHFKETISGYVTIRAFGHQERFANVNVQRVNTNICISFHNGGANEWLTIRLETIGIVILCTSALFLVLLPKSFVNPELVGLSLSYGLALSGCLNYMIFYVCHVEQNMVSVERILQYSSIEPEQIPAKEDSCPGVNWPESGNVAVQSLQLRYRPNLPLVLKNLTFVIEGGEKLGVVGRTGSGKSSFIQALFRLVEPEQGTIYIDGVDIKSVPLNELRSKLSIIPQEPTLFEGTVRSNIDPLGVYQDDQIWEALKRCQLSNTVMEKELKLDAPVAENGDNWSMGQRQLFCLGRVLLKRSKILVLDEATASIDTQTDWVLQKIIKQEFVESTVISVAHRIPSVMDSDKVLVLDKGEVKEFGVPSALLGRRDGLFSGLVHEYWSRSKSAHNLAEMN